MEIFFTAKIKIFRIKKNFLCLEFLTENDRVVTRLNNIRKRTRAQCQPKKYEKKFQLNFCTRFYVRFTSVENENHFLFY